MKLLSIMPERVARGSFYFFYILSCDLVSVSFCFYWTYFHAYGDKNNEMVENIRCHCIIFCLGKNIMSLFKDFGLVVLITRSCLRK